MSVDGGALPPWRRVDNFGLRAHQNVVERLNGLSVLSPPAEGEIVSSPSSKGFLDRRPNRAVNLVSFVRIQATEDGGGKYSGVRLNRPTSPSDINSIVSQEDLGDVGDPIYIINALERDQDTHDLSMIEGDRPKDFIGVYLFNDPLDGTPTYGIVGFQITDCEGSNTLVV